MSYGMFAPRPTKNGFSLVLFARLTGNSLPSSASTVRTVYLPLTAVQVPRPIAGEDAPAARVPEYEPVRVLIVAPESDRTVTVTPCAPAADAWVPWLRIVTEKVTVWPADGLPGDQLTTEATRSELLTGDTTRLVGLV